MSAHEVDGDRSYHDEEVDRLSRVLQTQEVDVGALMFGCGNLTKSKYSA
jgi:hypothetical protein